MVQKRAWPSILLQTSIHQLL